jgi:hypothetical protein
LEIERARAIFEVLKLVAIQSLSTIKKGTSPFNFQLNGPFWSFYDNAFNKNFICPRA